MKRLDSRAGRGRRPRRPAGPALRTQRAQRGMTMLVVLMLMIVMLLGAGALGRMTEARSQITGNLAFREAAVAAAEVGTNTAFDATRALGDEEWNSGTWYYAQARPAMADGSGLPAIADWEATPSVAVGAYTIHYVVERMCNTTPVMDFLADCLVRQMPNDVTSVSSVLDPPNSRQFRATVRVTGPKNTLVFVQSMLTR